MNILHLHSHDTGRCIQPYGYPVPTPQLQQFAEQGVLFRNAFCAGPTCSPSRASLLTGTWPHVNGMLGLAHRGRCRLHDYSWHLARYLRDHGYATALVGTQHEVDHEGLGLLGYQRMLHQERYPAWAKSYQQWCDAVALLAADYLRFTDPAKPFFLSCGFDLTHRTGTGTQWHYGEQSPAGDARYVRPPVPIPDTPATRADFADFRVAAAHLDRCMGLVLDALAQAGLAERTLVIVTTDHGIAYPFMKCNLTDHGTGVMLMLRGPGGFDRGQVVDALVSQIDVYPTICRLAGLPVPPWVAGSDLGPLVRGEVSQIHDAIFSEVNWHGAAEPMRTIRTERYRYVRRYGARRLPVLPNCDDSPAKEVLLAAGWATRPVAGEEFYDLLFDPAETCNRASDPACAEPLAAHRARLHRWMQETRDPLLSGRLDPQPGMLLNPVDDPSPQSGLEPAVSIPTPEALLS